MYYERMWYRMEVCAVWIRVGACVTQSILNFDVMMTWRFGLYPGWWILLIKLTYAHMPTKTGISSVKITT